MEQGDEIKNSKKSKIDEAANKKGKSIFIALIICCLLIGVPLFIDWIIIGNSFP